jgi:dolichyl-phosphate-mannose-protein mannosyltransferase
VTALGSGMPDRESTTDDAPRRGIGRQIAAIMAIGLIFRLILAYGIDGLRGSGFGADLGLFNYWADTLAQHGPWGFYASASYADYTPGYLYALWPIGALREVFGAAGVATDITDSLIKLPAIITDVLLGYLVASMALELGVTRRRALIAAAVVILNPITWFDSVIWGQVDSFGTLFLLLGMRELWRGRHERSAVLAVVAALIKPQLAILVPIVAVVAIRRALWPKGS